jgi:hypothetical protein
LAIAVQHHKTEEQVPKELLQLWNALRTSDLVQIESAAHWNMASKRMEVQARCGDILVALGGADGVCFLADLYHDAGRPVVPLSLRICAPDVGARRLFNFGLSSDRSQRLFRATGVGPHGWMNRINFRSDTPIPEQVGVILELLEALDPPRAFVVRLLNDEHPEFGDVQNYFDTVVQPVVEGELGFKMTVVDGRQPLDHPRLDQEIFAKLHRSGAVIADITGMRPNCYLELGYALGRGLPTVLTAKKGIEHPFDLYTVAGLHWTTAGTVDERRRQFREHWNATRTRPALVPAEPLIS